MLGSNVIWNVVIVFCMNGYGGKVKVWLENYKFEIVVDIYFLFGYIRFVIVLCDVVFGSYVLIIKMLKVGNFFLCGVMVVGKFVL